MLLIVIPLEGYADRAINYSTTCETTACVSVQYERRLNGESLRAIAMVLSSPPQARHIRRTQETYTHTKGKPADNSVTIDVLCKVQCCTNL